MASANTDPRTHAYLYVLGVPNGTPHKIGFSYVPQSRAKAMIREGYNGAHVVTQQPIPWKKAAYAERYAHYLLREKHHEGEWFNVTREEAIEAIEKATAPEMMEWYERRIALPLTNQPKTKIVNGEYIYTKFPAGTRQRFHALLGDSGHSDFVRSVVEAALTEAEAVSSKPSPAEG